MSATSRLTLAGRFRRLLEWFWLGTERRRVGDAVARAPRADEFVRRAELAVELAERARRPAETFVHGDGEAHACELFRQAAHWALSAQVPHESFSGVSPSLAWLWEQADPDVLARAAGGSEERNELKRSLVERTFADFAELDRAERVALATRTARFSAELLNPLRAERPRVARIWTLRLVRIGGLAFVLSAMAIVASRTVAWNDERRDFARRATWSVSSISGFGGCPSPAQTCAESPSFFFHTQQEMNPSVTFDLGRSRGFSRVTLENRLDCCPERAVPLVLEVSENQKQWKRLARRDEVFTTWKASFPRVRARFVRLRIDGVGMLHLSRVRILP